MRVSFIILGFCFACQAPTVFAQSRVPQLQVEQPIIELNRVNTTVFVPDDGTLVLGGLYPGPTRSVFVDGAYVDHRGGPLLGAYDDGFATRVGLNSLIAPVGMNSNLFWTGGFEYQRWNNERFNVNTLMNNYSPDGNADLFGGFLGVGFEESTPLVVGFPVLSDIEAFFFLRGTACIGQMEQYFQDRPFDPDLFTINLGDVSPKTSATYASGLFSAGAGVSTHHSSLAFVMSYQILQTDIITNRSSETDSVFYGLQGTIVLDGVLGRNRPPVLNRVPYVNRLFRNTGVGRETESLQLMVTPRIIIQDE